MSWDAVGAMAELAGAVAVIVSILYLARQVKQSVADVRANIIHSLHANEVEVQAQPATDLILARAVEKAYTGPILGDDERAQFTMWFYAAMINIEQVYIEYKRLGVETELFEAQRARIAGGLEPELVQAVWNRLKFDFRGPFKTMRTNTARTSSHSVGKLYVMALYRARIICGNAALSPRAWCSGVIQ